MAEYKTFVGFVGDRAVLVRLYDETIDHIAASHPELAPPLFPLVDAIGRAIARPSTIERSYGDSLVFTDFSTTSASGNPLRIPVKKVTDHSFRVKTAYLGRVPARVDIIWRAQP